MTLSEEYASHEPVLKAIAKQFKIETILEFGCGESSTFLFLNKEFFPNVKELISFESNAEWGRKIGDLIKDDRLKLFINSEAYFLEMIIGMQQKYDLIFVDGATAEYRIPSLIASIKYTDIIVAHDTEKVYWTPLHFYTPLINSFASYVYNKLIPNTTAYIRHGKTINFNGIL